MLLARCLSVRPLAVCAIMVAQMDDKNRALCWSYRFPRTDGKKVKLSTILKEKLVVKRDGHVGGGFKPTHSHTRTR